MQNEIAEIDKLALADQGQSVMDVLDRKAEQAPYEPGFLNLKINHGSKSFEAGALGSIDAPVDAVVLAVDFLRSFWPQGSDDEKEKMEEWCGRRPLCASRGNGGIRGELPKDIDKDIPKNIKDLLKAPVDIEFVCGTPRKPSCKWNMFGTADRGEGKACKETRRLLLYVLESSTLAVLTVSPASLSAWRDYENSMPGRRVDTCITSIGLTVQTVGQIKYSVLDFSPVKEKGSIVPLTREMLSPLGRIVNYGGDEVVEIEATLNYFGQLEIKSESEEEEEESEIVDDGVPFEEGDKEF